MTIRNNSSQTAKAQRSGIWAAIWKSVFYGQEGTAPVGWHTLLAQSMVIFALAGAIVAGAAAVAEQEAQRLERLLTWGHHLAFIYRQELLADNSSLETLKVLSDSHTQQANEYLKKSVKQPELVRQTQKEFAAARALRPFRGVLQGPLELGFSEASLQRQIAFEMAPRGFETSWIEPPKPPPGLVVSPRIPNIWGPLDHRLDKSHEMVRYLSFSVVLFVAALVSLTLADILCHGRLLHNTFFVLGWLIEIGAMIFVFLIGKLYFELLASLFMILWSQGLPQIILFMVPPLFLSFLFLLAFYRFFSLWYNYKDIPEYLQEELEEEENLELESFEFEGPHLPSYKKPVNDFSRAAVLLIALAVFASAVCGLGYSYTVSRAGDAAHEALESVSQMHDRSSILHNKINHFLLVAATMEEHRAQAAVLQQQLPGEPVRVDDFTAMAASQAEAHSRIFREESIKIAQELTDPEIGVEADRWFPEKLKAKPLEKINWWESLALWELASQRSLAWHAKAQILLGILTVLAMAIYLFAQAHSLEEGFGGRRLMRYGLALLGNSLICFLIILLVTLQENHRGEAWQEAEAAKAFGAAIQKYQTARSSQDFLEVIDDLNKAIEHSPNFARAHLVLAYNLHQGRLFQAWDPYINIARKDTLPDAIKHLKLAEKVMLANGYAVPMILLNSLGNDTLLLGFDKRDLARVRDSVTYLQKAKKDGIHGGNKVIQAMVGWNLAIARVAAGDSREIDPEVFRQLAEAGDIYLFLSCFTDLDILDKYYPYLHGGTNCQAAVEQAKQRLVAVFPPNTMNPPDTSSPLPVCDDLHPGEPDIIVSPHGLEWRGQLPSPAGDQDKLCLICYIKDTDWGCWRALSKVSGPVGPQELFPDKTIPGTTVIRRSYLAKSDYQGCLPHGIYRAELYLNDRLFPSPSEDVNLPEYFAPHRLLHLNVGLCCPKDWKLYHLPKEMGDNEFVGRIFTNPKQQPAACVFSFYGSRSVEDSQAITWARQILSQEPLNLPDNWVLAPYDPKACVAPPPGVAGLYKQWVTPDGVHHVGVVFIGTAPFCDLCNTLASMDNLYKVEVH